MKKFLLLAVTLGALSTVAVASNDNSTPYRSYPDLVVPLNQNAVPKVMKKKIYNSESNSITNSIGETGNVSEKDRILEKGGNDHDVSPY
jgi:hypothetical protein